MRIQFHFVCVFTVCKLCDRLNPPKFCLVWLIHGSHCIGDICEKQSTLRIIYLENDQRSARLNSISLTYLYCDHNLRMEMEHSQRLVKLPNLAQSSTQIEPNRKLQISLKSLLPQRFVLVYRMSLTMLISLAILLWLSGRSGLRGLCVCVVVSGGDDVTVCTVCEFVCVLTD